MKKLFITAACIITVLSASFAHAATGKHKAIKNDAPTLNATVAVVDTRVIVTALNEFPYAVDVTLQDEQGNEVYEGKLAKGDYSQTAVFNLNELGEGTYSIVLRNDKDKLEKKIVINTTKQLAIK